MPFLKARKNKLPEPEFELASMIFFSVTSVVKPFILVHNTAEATKSICWAKVEVAVDHRTLIRWFMKFSMGCKNLDDQISLKGLIPRPWSKP